MLLYLVCQLIHGNLNLALDVISKHLSHSALFKLKIHAVKRHKRQSVMKFLPCKEILDFGEFALCTCQNLDMELVSPIW